MLTLFSVPKAFVGEYTQIQENAIQSWLSLTTKPPEIILLGNEKGIKNICRKYKLLHIPTIKRNKYGTPLLNDIFEKAQYKASNNTLMYSNADIVYTHNIDNVIKKLTDKFEMFVSAGKRYELHDVQIDFNKKNWGKIIQLKCQIEGELKGPSWMDYFIFTKGAFGLIPQFALGRTFWDKWLLWKASSTEVPLINTTFDIFAIHQSHGYTYNGSTSSRIWEGTEALENIQMAGGWSNGHTLNDADWNIKQGHLIQAKKTNYLMMRFAKKLVDTMPFSWPLLMKLRYLKIKNGINREGAILKD